MLHEISFVSSNERDQIQAWIYVPAAKPKGVVQIIHGFGEHSRRYFHMIVGFLEAGYIVTANDHVGHGKTAIVNNSWGNWGYQGFQTMTEDEHRLRLLVSEKYPGLPYFIYGHSMGSIIARAYAAKYGNGLTGITLCGTLGSDSLPTALVKPKLQAVIEANGPDSANPELVGELLGGMFSRCPDFSIGNEWICADPYVQADHAADPFDAFTKPITNLSVLYFIEMIEDVMGRAWAEKIPVGLPFYNIAGDQDPVGSFGKGVYECSNWLVETGHPVVTKVYSGYRHEIHNYKAIKNEVVAGIVSFMDSLVGKE
ncbi:alpha/beta fold hydrolase [Clostridiales bacterium COT073_COT-073]|nr:alpha/beta fold hydrolase [Clostridiales bacterium COT073_COT-073]